MRDSTVARAVKGRLVPSKAKLERLQPRALPYSAPTFFSLVGERGFSSDLSEHLSDWPWEPYLRDFTSSLSILAPNAEVQGTGLSWSLMLGD